jgi:uncharacterized lipoprotein YajG
MIRYALLALLLLSVACRNPMALDCQPPIPVPMTDAHGQSVVYATVTICHPTR